MTALAATQPAPPDPIVGLVTAWRADSATVKPNLAQGAYRGDAGEPVVFEAVREAERRVVAQELDKEYLPIEGDAGFLRAAGEMCFGEGAAVLTSGCLVSLQTPGSTAALRLAGDFALHLGAAVALPDHTWPNHGPVFAGTQCALRTYSYALAPGLDSFDLPGALRSLEELPPKSLVLFHAAAHNPTGIDPSAEQWRELAAFCKRKGHLAFFDMAYQGFCTGDLGRDAGAVRCLAAEGVGLVVAQSLSKNMGLYGERVGVLHVVAESREQAEAVRSRLRQMARAAWSCPPAHGARIAGLLWRDPELRQCWLRELRGVVERLVARRAALRAALERSGTPSPTGHGWGHVTAQAGMFGYTGLTPDHVALLRSRHHVYMTKSARISVAGLLLKEVDYVAAAFADVLRSSRAAL